ncbi:MAG: AsmA family protein, partial [Salinivirgaceae bacterium]
MKIGTTLRKTGKILLITILSLILLLVIVVTIALHSEKTITDLALEEVSAMFDAPVKVDEVSLLLFRNFPYATVEFSGFKLGVANKQHGDSVSYGANDTLLSLRKFYVSVKSRPLINNKIEIQKIEIEGFAFNYLVDTAGATNIDFLMASDTTTVEPEEEPIPVDTSASVLDMLLQNLTIRDITVNFRDKQMGAAAKIHIPEMDISGRVLDEYYAGKINGIVVLSNADFEGTNLSFMKKTSLAFDIDYEDGKIKIQSVDFLTDGAGIDAAGYAVLGDSIFMDMGVNLTHMDLKELSKYAPAEILKEYGVLSIDGKINIDTKIKGYYYDTLLLPAIETKISMSGGKVKTTEYPELAELSMQGDVFVPNVNDMSTMSAKFSSVKIATPKSTINMAFDVANFEKPRYTFKTNGTVTLDEFNDFLPDSTVEYISGAVDFALATNGVLPDDLGVNSADYFLDRTLLEVHLRDIATAVDAETEVKNFSADFYYNPSRDVALTDLTVSVPSYNVTIDNFTVKTKLIGSVSDMDNMGVNVDSLFFKMGNTSLVAKATVRGLKVPTYTLDANLQVDLDELKPHIPDTLVQHIAGRVGFKVNSYGTVDLDSVETQMMPIAFEQTTMQLDVADFSFAMPDDTLAKINSLNFSFAMANDTMRLDRFHANAHGIDMWIDSTEVWNVYKAMLLEQKDKSIIVNAHINLSDIDYAQFEPLMEEEEPKSGSIDPEGNSGANRQELAQSDGAPQTDLGNEAAAGTQKGTASASASAQAVA